METKQEPSAVWSQTVNDDSDNSTQGRSTLEKTSPEIGRRTYLSPSGPGILWDPPQRLERSLEWRRVFESFIKDIRSRTGTGLTGLLRSGASRAEQQVVLYTQRGSSYIFALWSLQDSWTLVYIHRMMWRAIHGDIAEASASSRLEPQTATDDSDEVTMKTPRMEDWSCDTLQSFDPLTPSGVRSVTVRLYPSDCPSARPLLALHPQPFGRVILKARASLPQCIIL
ncbi:hypothetical protein CRENBAI_009061 [Crenichthys baileyi]|uniref:Uncharacterized protein n=1 Tax=Crenichthys baileyi TaxID=28760 RepID=A0AAV9QTN4_9TELE